MQRTVIQTASNVWKYPMSGCCDDPVLCCSATACCCCLQGVTASKLDGTSKCEACWLSCLTVCVYNCIRRGQMRKLNNIDGDYCCDCLESCFCLPCARVQEARQVGAVTGMFCEWFNISNIFIFKSSSKKEKPYNYYHNLNPTTLFLNLRYKCTL